MGGLFGNAAIEIAAACRIRRPETDPVGDTPSIRAAMQRLLRNPRFGKASDLLGSDGQEEIGNRIDLVADDDAGGVEMKLIALSTALFAALGVAVPLDRLTAAAAAPPSLEVEAARHAGAVGASLADASPRRSGVDASTPTLAPGGGERREAGDNALRAPLGGLDRADHQTTVRRLKALKFSMELLSCVMTPILAAILLKFSDWLEMGDRRRNAIRTAWIAIAIYEVGNLGLVIFISGIIATV